MLSRTADHLYWMARYLERAENMSRLLDVTYQMSLVPQDEKSERKSWNAILALNSLEKPFAERYSKVTPQSVLRFMVRDETHPASIFSCLRATRENARAVRGTLTSEMWETINEAWLEVSKLSFDDMNEGGLAHEGSVADFFEWVKQRSSLMRGSMFGTMPQDEAFQFLRLGTLLERADNTARILDVKYYSLTRSEQKQSDAGGEQMQAQESGSVGDFYHWGALLRSVSAFEVYRKVYRDIITPERAAELLILRDDLPRALHTCLRGIVAILDQIKNPRSAETLRRAGQLYSNIRYGTMDDIHEKGLHIWLDDFLERIGDLGARINQDFLVGDAKAT